MPLIVRVAGTTSSLLRRPIASSRRGVERRADFGHPLRGQLALPPGQLALLADGSLLEQCRHFGVCRQPLAAGGVDRVGDADHLFQPSLQVLVEQRVVMGDSVAPQVQVGERLERRPSTSRTLPIPCVLSVAGSSSQVSSTGVSGASAARQRSTALRSRTSKCASVVRLAPATRACQR